MLLWSTTAAAAAASASAVCAVLGGGASARLRVRQLALAAVPLAALARTLWRAVAALHDVLRDELFRVGVRLENHGSALDAGAAAGATTRAATE